MGEGASNPEYRSQTNVVNVSSKHNKEPLGYKWVDEEGWVSLEKESSGDQLLSGANFCADAMRFRRGGYRKFLRGEINQMCI